MTKKIAVSAKKIAWKLQPDGQWHDQTYGFTMWRDADFQKPFFVSWDVGVASQWLIEHPGSWIGNCFQFANMREAKAWCQLRADEWIRAHAVTRTADVS